nr:GntR family transcriptional regulator [Micromonospora sp. DSM 115978]
MSDRLDRLADAQAERARQFALRRPKPALHNNSVDRSYELLLWALFSSMPDGTQLDEGDLARRLSASRTTVRKVLTLMAAQGLLERKRKVGTVVQRPEVRLDPDLRTLRVGATRGGASLGRPTIKTLESPPLIGHPLRCTPEDRTALIEADLQVQDRRIGSLAAYVIVGCVDSPTLPQRRPEQIFGDILRSVAITATDLRVRIASLPPGAEESAAGPTLWIENDLVSADGQVVAFVIVRCDGSQVLLTPVAAGPAPCLSRS